MWQKIYDLFRLVFNLGEDLRQNRANVERLEQEVRELTLMVQRLAFELQRVRENEAHEREKLELRLKVQVLESGKQLPSGERNSEQ